MYGGNQIAVNMNGFQREGLVYGARNHGYLLGNTAAAVKIYGVNCLVFKLRKDCFIDVFFYFFLGLIDGTYAFTVKLLYDLTV
jgi:hypothetical protein